MMLIILPVLHTPCSWGAGWLRGKWHNLLCLWSKGKYAWSGECSWLPHTHQLPFTGEKGAGSPLKAFAITNYKYISIIELILPSGARGSICPWYTWTTLVSSTGLNFQEGSCPCISGQQQLSSSYTIYFPIRTPVPLHTALQGPAQSDKPVPLLFCTVCSLSLFVTTFVASFSQMQVQVIILFCIILQTKPKLFRSTAAVV